MAQDDLWYAAASLRAVPWPAHGTPEHAQLADGRVWLIRGVRTRNQAHKHVEALQRAYGCKTHYRWDRESQQMAILCYVNPPQGSEKLE